MINREQLTSAKIRKYFEKKKKSIDSCDVLGDMREFDRLHPELVKERKEFASFVSHSTYMARYFPYGISLEKLKERKEILEKDFEKLEYYLKKYDK